MDEKEEEEMVTVVEKGGQGDVEEEDFILREQVNSLKLQVTHVKETINSDLFDDKFTPDPES